MTGPYIRSFQAHDIAFALVRTAAEGWDATAELFETCLAHDPGGGFVAEAGGAPVGMITTTRYARSGWIGNLIVLPEYRRRGIGERLMRHAMAHLASAGVGTIRLEADPPGVPLYRKLGFADEFETPRYRRPASPAVTAGPDAAAVRCHRSQDGDLPPVVLRRMAIPDIECFGDDRTRLLGLLMQRAHAAYWLPRGATLAAYALVTPSLFGARLGPWLAADAAAADLLLGAVLADWSGRDLILGVPGTNGRAGEVLARHRFERQPSCRRMMLGPPGAAGRPEYVFAIANGAMG